MKIIYKFIAVFLICSLPVEAKPNLKSWRFWLTVGVSLSSSLMATHEIHECRLRFGPAPCDGGYGEFKAREITRGIGSIGLDLLGLWGEGMGIKEAYVPALGFSAYNASVAYRQTLKGCPAGEHYLYGTKFTCVENYYPGGW